MKPDMTFAQLLEASGPRDKCEVYSAVPNPGPDDELTWRVHLHGHGVYMGRADKDESGNLLIADPHTFIAEN
jgi:hypothetical protein